MDGSISVRYLQEYIREKDYKPELLKDYFLKLSEEVGELSRAMRKGLRAADKGEISGTVDGMSCTMPLQSPICTAWTWNGLSK